MSKTKTRPKRGADPEIHKCVFCGHDGGEEEVKERDPIVGVGGFACVNEEECRRRIKSEYYGAEVTHLPPHELWFR